MARADGPRHPVRARPRTPEPAREAPDPARALRYEEATYFAGPLPSPQSLHDYDHALPGAADRIISMAEREARHRHAVEHRMLDIHGRNSTLGICAGGLIGLSAILGGVHAVVQGADLAGAGVALTGLAALVGVFVLQHRSEQREAAEKEEDQPPPPRRAR